MKAMAEVISFEEARSPKGGGSDGGFDHFSTMELGTVFSVSRNNDSSSFLTDYVLQSKSGVTALLGEIDPKGHQNLCRVIGNKFWKQHTLVQILYVPKKEEENGQGV